MKKKKFGKYDDRKLGWLRDGKKFAVILIIAVVVFRFIIGVSWVSGESMYPTYHDGETVVYNRLVGHYSRGDVVSVKMPDGKYMIKRIIAVGGDTLDISGGKVTVNGRPEMNSERFGETQPQSGTVSYPVKLGEGQIFVIGDNREKSVDSRTYGILYETQIRGKIIFSLF